LASRSVKGKQTTFYLRPDREFNMSLNGRDTLEGDEVTLSELGIVSGDLVFVTTTGGDQAAVNVQQNQNEAATDRQYPPKLLDSLTCETVSVSGTSDQRGTGSTGGTAEQSSVCPGPSTEQTSADQQTSSPDAAMEWVASSGDAEAGTSYGAGPYEGAGPNEGEEIDLTPVDPVDPAVVNTYLNEPMLCRDSTDTTVPARLQQLYAAAQPSSAPDAVCIVLHTLMLETGYQTVNQVHDV
jgi:hypothetical protein